MRALIPLVMPIAAIARTLWAADAPLVDAPFKSDVAPLVLGMGEPRFEDGCVVLASGAKLVLRTNSAISGDLAISLLFREPFHGDAEIRLLGVPALTARFSPQRAAVIPAPMPGQAGEPPSVGREHSLASPREIVLRVRNVGAELDVDGIACAATEFERPLGGGFIEIELATTEATLLDAVRIERMQFPDRDHVLGMDDAQLAKLAGRPIEHFKLLEPLPRHLDPIYRVQVDGVAEPLVIHARGYRSDASPIPLLEQALAFAQIRPWLEFQFLKGEGGSAAEKIPLSADGKSVTIDSPPGAIRLSMLCGVLDEWPVLLVLDATRNRVLIRSNPGGPASADVWSTIPKQCQRLRIVIAIPDRPALEREIDILRP